MGLLNDVFAQNVHLINIDVIQWTNFQYIWTSIDISNKPQQQSLLITNDHRRIIKYVYDRNWIEIN